MGTRTRVPITVLSALFFQDSNRSETLLKPACRNWLTAGSVMTMLLAVSSAQDQMKVGARVRVMSRWSLSFVSVGARTEAMPITLVRGRVCLVYAVMIRMTDRSMTYMSPMLNSRRIPTFFDLPIWRELTTGIGMAKIISSAAMLKAVPEMAMLVMLKHCFCLISRS